MDREGEIQSRILCEQIPQVELFVRNLTYYQSLSETSLPNEDQDFWEEVSYAFLGAAILAWYNVFGSCKSHVYWSKLIENIPPKVEQDFINRIYNSTGLKKEEFKKFRVYIKTLRDKYFAHRDRDWQKHIWNSPDFDNALKIAKVYECWVNDLLNKEGSASMNSLTDNIQSDKNEVEHILSFYKKA